jgi:dTDP-4-dehydrorhamnose reductase
MRPLVLGGTGMLGHKLWQIANDRAEAYATVRTDRLQGPAAAVLDPEHTITGVRADDLGTVEEALERAQPDVVFNCIGIVKQADEASDPVTSIGVNSLFPHELAHLCSGRGIRVVQVSTDCVFSGRRGAYTEEDRPDPEDLYGRTKLLGELEGEGCLTIRTSIIGRELSGALGLVEWLLAQRGEVRGFTRAVFSGLTTRALSEALLDLAAGDHELDGVRHLSADPITKHDLLVAVRDAYGLDLEIRPDDAVAVDRSLDSTLLRNATGWTPPSWPQMIAGLISDPTPYEEVRDAGADR